MPGPLSPYTVYQSILDPWNSLAIRSPDVVNLRLIAVPWLLITDPLQASREIQQMITEKQEALNETVLAISQTPTQLWFDMFKACWSGNPYQAANKALIDNSERLAYPSGSRVAANQKRLGHSR